MKKILVPIFYIFIYFLTGILLCFFLLNRGGLPLGHDTMYYICQAESLIDSFAKGIYFPSYDGYFYNTVVLYRVIPHPIPYILAVFQMAGSMFFGGVPYVGYYVYTIFLIALGAVGFLAFGIKKERPWLGGFLGMVWFFTPAYLQSYFVDGNLSVAFSLAVMPYFVSALFSFVEDKKYHHLAWMIITGIGMFPALFTEDISIASDTVRFGVSVCILAVFGVLFSYQKESRGFMVGLFILIITSPVMSPVMSAITADRFAITAGTIMAAYVFVFYSTISWKTLRNWIAVVFCILPIIDILPTATVALSPIIDLDIYTSNALLDQAKEITGQRLAIMDEGALSGVVDYYMARGEKKVRMTQGTKGDPATKKNVDMLDEAMEQGAYYYLFDRCIELGDDTVLVEVSKLRDAATDLPELEKAALAVGYKRAAYNGEFILFHYDTYDTFGVKTDYRAFGIGTSADAMEFYFPNMTDGDSEYVDDYSFEELSDYHTIMLDHFEYHDKKTAEDLIKKLADSGVRIVVSSDGMPVNKELQEYEFLGVKASDIQFENGYPLLYLNGKEHDMDLFLEQNKKWRTTFVNGLSSVEGYFRDAGIEEPFLGTVYNDNIYFVGINLFYHFTSTHDLTAADMIEYVFDMDMYELPKRRIVPLEVNYGPDAITVVSGEDDVDSTIAFSKGSFLTDDGYNINNLYYVNKGENALKVTHSLRQTARRRQKRYKSHKNYDRMIDI